MHIDMNGTRLWFDVDGAALVPDGAEMRLRPTVVLVHGGPGVWDHSYFKPDFAPLAERAQIVYLDLRGHGRSDWGDIATFSFEACADDIRAFCDTVGYRQSNPLRALDGQPDRPALRGAPPRTCSRAHRPVRVCALRHTTAGRGLPPRRGRWSRGDRKAQLRRRGCA